MRNQEISYLTNLGGALSALGIVFISDRSVAYSIIGGLRQREKSKNNERNE